MQHICARSPNDPIVEGCDADHAPMRQCGEGHIAIILFDLCHALLDVYLILLDLYPILLAGTHSYLTRAQLNALFICYIILLSVLSTSLSLCLFSCSRFFSTSLSLYLSISSVAAFHDCQRISTANVYLCGNKCSLHVFGVLMIPLLRGVMLIMRQ